MYGPYNFNHAISENSENNHVSENNYAKSFKFGNSWMNHKWLMGGEKKKKKAYTKRARKINYSSRCGILLHWLLLFIMVRFSDWVFDVWCTYTYVLLLILLLQSNNPFYYFKFFFFPVTVELYSL